MTEVVAACGLLDLGHIAHVWKQDVRYRIIERTRRVVLARPLVLNHERYAAEAKRKLRRKKKPKAAKDKRSANQTSLDPGQFGDDD